MSAPATGWERRVEVLLGVAASLILLAMMLLTFIDVVARYVVNRPVRGAFEVTELMLLVLIFAGLPLVSFTDEHALMDFVDRLLGPRAQRGLEGGVQALCGVLMLLLAWIVWLKADRISAYRDATDVLRILYGPFVYFMAAAIGLAGVIHLYKAIEVTRADERPVIEGLVGLAAMMVIAFLRVPIAYAMGIVGIVGYAYMRDWNWLVASAMVQTKIYETGRNYALSVVPLFILMGNFVTRAGMSEELFRAAYTFIGHLRGGLAMATVWASAGFGGICGSSIATTATMAKVAYPSMKRFGYHDRIAAGTVAGAGTLGIMIPPSTIMVIYGVFTETNIGKLFMAGILPGLLGAILLCLAIAYTTWRHPSWGPRGPRSSWAERGSAVKDVWAVAALFLFVMGGIYGGLFTATEGAGMGAMGALGFALSRRALTWRTLYAALLESARTTAMLFVILIGALIFAEFVNITTMPVDLTAFVARFAVHPTMLVAAICAVYVVLGTAMEELSMVLLTMPVFFPVIVHLGFDPVWFGIIIVCVVEIGLISPPVGMNMFVLKTLLPEVSTGTVFRGVMPFMWADVVRLAILVAFPIISLWLPRMMR